MHYTKFLTVSVAALGLVLTGCNKDDVVVDKPGDGLTGYRPATQASSPYSTRVYEYTPAPGQFINEGEMAKVTTPSEACTYAQKRLDSRLFVSLGAFGGYIVVGFDHSIVKNTKGGDYDFAIMGNAFFNAGSPNGGSSEPGIVWVMQDENQNGLPDDTWYQLCGSETGLDTTVENYAVTYYRPAKDGENIVWKDNRGNEGTVDYVPQFHSQASYYPAWMDGDSYTLTGTYISAHTSQDSSTGFWNNSAFAWGYADNMGTDNLERNSSADGSGQRNGFKIANAIKADGSSANLEYIDFIKVQTGVQSKAGWLGEVSTEVCNFQDLSLIGE